jgi:23S rRNA (uridine2552-2'-O)-methyltransferase
MREISALLSRRSHEERAKFPCIGHDRADLVVRAARSWSDHGHLAGRTLGIADRGIREGICVADGPRRAQDMTRASVATDRKGARSARPSGSSGSSNDPYVKKARAEGYRSRAAYKLIELNDRFKLLGGVKRVVDLGIAPGGWTQVVRRVAPQAIIVGIDLLEMDPIEGAVILHMNFLDDGAADQLKEALGGPADLVLSDMAANTVGHPQTDHLRTMALVEAGLDFAGDVLRPGGAYVAKVLAGGADNNLVSELKRRFTTVKHAKPPASRKGSSEWYVVAQGFKS